jgi:hypothetical protein
MKIQASYNERGPNTVGKEIDVWPLKSIGNPDRGLFSAAPDIALVTTFWNFTYPDVKLCKNGCLDEMWEELVSFVQDASLYSVLKFAVLVIILLREEDKQGLIVVMSMPGVEVAAIFNHLRPLKIKPKFCNIENMFW